MSRKRVALFVFLRQSSLSRLRSIWLDLVAASFQLAESAKMKSRRHEEARWNQRRHYRLGPTGMQSCGQTPLTDRRIPPQFSRRHSRGGRQSHSSAWCSGQPNAVRIRAANNPTGTKLGAASKEQNPNLRTGVIHGGRSLCQPALD